MDYAKAIKKLMAKNGLDTAKQLADKLEMTESAIDKIINGETRQPSMATLNKMAIVFNIPLYVLLWEC